MSSRRTPHRPRGQVMSPPPTWPLGPDPWQDKTQPTLPNPWAPKGLQSRLAGGLLGWGKPAGWTPVPVRAGPGTMSSISTVTGWWAQRPTACHLFSPGQHADGRPQQPCGATRPPNSSSEPQGPLWSDTTAPSLQEVRSPEDSAPRRPKEGSPAPSPVPAPSVAWAKTTGPAPRPSCSSSGPGLGLLPHHVLGPSTGGLAGTSRER